MFRRIANLFRSTPSQEFISTFAQPQHVRVIASSTTYLDGIQAAQEVGQILASVTQPLIAQIDAALAMAQEWSQTLPSPMSLPEATRIADESLLQQPWVPTGKEFDALFPEHASTNIAAVLDVAQRAKRVRVHALAAECGVDSKTMRGWLDTQFGIATKSPSSTVTASQAAAVTAWVATHQDA